MTKSSLKPYIAKNRRLVDRALHRFLPKEKQKPRLIHKAMRYSVFAGGKRLRPILAIAGAEACGGKAHHVLPVACALELIHTYSLIHDDLPAMDNDDLRRGRPTNHKVFGDDIAILAGDALLTHAFYLVRKNAEIKGVKGAAIPLALEILARGAGTDGMVGGQVADIKSDKGRWQKMTASRNGLSEFSGPEPLLDFIHRKKTAALISASLEAGGCLVGATPKQRKALHQFGQSIGLAFQIRDDILDEVGDKKKLGKKGSDKANKKLTFPALYGLEKSNRMGERHIQTAYKALTLFGPKGQILRQLADYVLSRDH